MKKPIIGKVALDLRHGENCGDGADQRASALLDAALRAWNLSARSADLSEYDRAIDELACLRGGCGAARRQMEALLHRLAWGGAEGDEEDVRDRRLVLAALENIGAR